MRPLFSSSVARTLLAVAVTAAAVALRWLLDPWLGGNVQLVTLFAAIAAAVWLGGYRPASLVAVLGYLACSYLFIEPRGALGFGVGDLIALLAYLVSACFLIAFGEAMRRAQLRASNRQELLRITLASIGDAVITTDPDGRVTSLNAVAEALTGWSQAAAAGQPLDLVFRIVNEDTRAGVENPATKALRLGTVVGLANHTVLIARDGTERAIDDSAAPIRDEESRIVGCVLVFRDITDRRRAQDELRRREEDLADFFEHASLGLHWVGPDGIILRVNQHELEMLGYEREEYVGRHIAEFHCDRSVIEDILGKLASGKTLHEYPAQLRSKDGSIRDVLINSNVLFQDGRFIHTRCFTLDITERKHAEATLRQAEAIARQRLHELETIYDTTPVGMCLLDRDLCFVRINDRLAEMNGAPAAEHIGRSLREMVPLLADELEPAFRRLLETGEAIIDIELTGETNARPGVQRSWLESWYPLRDSQGEVVGVNVAALEITDRKRAEAQLGESEALFRTMGEALPNCLWMADAGGRVLYQNPACYELVRTASGDQTLAAWESLLHPDDMPLVRQVWSAAIEAGQSCRVEARIRRHDGEYRWFAGRSVPLTDDSGRVIKWIGTLTDIHDLKQAEEALRTADRRKDEFLATLAHELRNPLAPVRSSLEILKRAESDVSLAQQARSTMERQLSHMERLIDDLLDISRITRNRLELRKQRVELASVLHHALEACRPLTEAFRHAVTVVLPPEPVYLDGDSVRLAQVFGNLLGNAAKYTDPGGRIRLGVEPEGSEVTVSVKDDGMGIAADMLPRIFEMFAQVDRSMERSQGGLGIGLSLVKRLVEMHGGSVQAFSDGPGRGSEFVVRLPILAPEPRDFPSHAPLPLAPQAPARRILVVDDNKDSAESLALLLRLTGHRTEVVCDGLEALAAAERLRPDVVLLDLGLPKLNGFDVCRRIRAQPWAESVLLVALTGWGQEEDRRKSKEAGFDAHMVKPVDHDELARLLSAAPHEAPPRP